MNQIALKYRNKVLGLALIVGALGIRATAQVGSYERTFNESPAAVKRALEKMQDSMAGHLPTLDGFALAGNRPLERYQRGYFQAVSQVSAGSGGKCVVRVSAKVTAWYKDPTETHGGYELLRSNGRIENDILDQLGEQLAANHPKQQEQVAADVKPEVVRPAMPDQAPPETNQPTASQQSEPTISAPQPRLFDTPSVSSSLSSGLASSVNTAAESAPQPKPPADPERTKLQDEIAQLQEVLKSQAHPRNMAAVRKPGTAVVANPSLNEKPMFLASAHDEFEILNYNQDWVHVRVSGLSRGWIWRNDLEMPDSIPDSPTAPPSPHSAEVFHVVREETSQFPGDWVPLRGKNVKLISIQRIDDSSKDAGPQLKLDFAKNVFDKGYLELSQKTGDLAGIVLIFDSADGGMIAVAQSTLAKWKSGALTESAFWQNCYFDPPEAFTPGVTSGTQ